MTSKFKELEILFYGNTYIPTSEHCWGCEHFNYLCEGSVYRGECPTGQVEEINDSEIALQILEDEQVNHNRFALARVMGLDLEEKEHTEHIEELKTKVANNLNNPDKKIFGSDNRK